MAKVILCSDFPYKDISVPIKFIDEYMPEANGEFVKVYLLLLRSLSSGTVCSISDIADKFDHTEKDVLRALKYWERMNLLRLDYDPSGKLISIHVKNIYQLDDSPEVSVESAPYSSQSEAYSTSAAPAASVVQPVLYDSSAGSTAPSDKHEYSLDEVKAFRQDPEISELFFIIEAYLKHPLGSSDTNTILYWYDTLQFVPDLIEYLVEYCISKGHSSIRYMDKVALSWASSGITTVEEAKANAATHSQTYYAVMKALGISGRNLVESEMNYIRKWTKEYGYDSDIITLACQRTISATHQPSFEYTDSIMTSWHDNKVKTAADIEKLDAAYNKSGKTKKYSIDARDNVPKRNKFTNFNQRNYDYDQLEKVLLTTTVQ